MIIIVAVFLFIAVYAFFKSGIKIDFKSFLMPTLPLDTGVFGVYCFTGKQGSGKTYSVTKFIIENHDNRKIYSNLTFYNGLQYEPITSIKHLLSLRDERNVIIIYDEILNLLNDSKIPRDIRDELLEFLTQQRKVKNIFITTSQEWLNIPIEFRRFVRIQIECYTRPLGKFGGILLESYYDAYNMKWDNLENEYIAPLISKKISKYQKRYMVSYDTFERIRKLKNA